ncbi:MAG: hypothetical protein D4R65_07910 [Verrucomicrobiaceae bacterium]|nr:MAG: hypothetical protein D4R65_07910 [Verrucomicrobiaceae bacterium]
MAFQQGGLRGFFGDRVFGKERIFLFLVFPPLLLATIGLIYVQVKPPARPAQRSTEPQAVPVVRTPALTPVDLMRSLDEAEAMEKQAVASGSQEAIQSACTAFEKIAASNPESDRAWGGLGRCLNAQQKYPEALHALDHACRLNIVEARHFGARGTARRAQGDFRGALADYGDSLRLKSGDPMVSNLILLLALQMGDEGLYSQKLNGIARSLSKAPDATWAIAAVASEMRAGNFELAAALLRQAGGIMPEALIQSLLKDPVFSDRRGQDFLEKFRSGAFAGTEQPAAVGN